MEGGLDAATKRRLAVPAVLFAAYVLHLVFLRSDPFLTRWLEGCFAFFLALVLAFLILRSSPAAAPREGEGPGEGETPGEGAAPPGGEAQPRQRGDSDRI